MRLPFALSALCRFLALCLLPLLLTPLAMAQTPTVTITPDNGEVESALMTIVIENLAANSDYQVEFVYGGEVVLRSAERSDGSGQIRFPASSTAGDLPGSYSVRVVQDGVVLASADFELTPKAMRGEVSVAPSSGPVGTLHTLSVTGLALGRQYTIAITAEATGEEVYRRARVSDDRGRISLEIFAQSGDATGAQSIAVSDAAGKLIASGAFHIEAENGEAVAISFEPSSAPAGGTVDITVSGLAAFASVSLQLRSAEGIFVSSMMGRASADGVATLPFALDGGLTPGDYLIEAFVEGEQSADATLTIVEASDAPADEAPAPKRPTPDMGLASASIQPQSATIGSSHRITVTDLQANESVTFEVRFDGALVYQTQKTADSQGMAQLELVTDRGDQPGDYTITAMRQAGNQPSVVLTALAASLASAPATDSRMIDGALDGGRQVLRFSAEAGQYLLLTVRSNDFEPAMTLLDSTGRRIGESSAAPGSDRATHGPWRAPSSGDYALEIYPSPELTDAAIADGEFTLTIEPLTLTPIRFDAANAFSLTRDNPAAYFTMRLESGDSISLSVDSGGSLDTLLRAVAPDGSEIAFDDDSGSGLDAEINNLAIETTGEYVAAIATFDGIAAGGGSLTVTRNAARALETESLIVTLNDKAERDIVVFDAAADELLLLRLEKLAGAVHDLVITASVDGMEVMSYMTMGVPDELPLPFVMPMSGQVLVELSKIGINDGISLAVSLERP